MQSLTALAVPGRDTEPEGRATSGRRLPAIDPVRCAGTFGGGAGRAVGIASATRAILVVAIGVLSAFAATAHADEPVPTPDEMRVMTEDRSDSQRLEKELQRLNWEQFRSIIEAIPKLKADVDAYGPAGWTFVKGRYQSYPWHRNIDKLDGEERQRLATLIENSRSAK